MGGGSLPQLGISSGPAVSEALGGSGVAGTGDFNFKPDGGLIQKMVPVIAIGVLAWIILKK